MLNYILPVTALTFLWFFSGVGVSFYLTRRTPLFRYFVSLSLFFTQLLIVLGSTVLATLEPIGIPLVIIGLIHGAGLLLSAEVIHRLGLVRFYRFARYRMTLPLLAVLLICFVLQMGPCIGQGQACFVTHLNDEYLNYSSNAQWLSGKAAGAPFEAIWQLLGHGRFGAELMLAYVSQVLAVPPIYAIAPLQAIERVQYLVCGSLLFHLLFTGEGAWRRWGATGAAFLLYISALESHNYILSFLAHHSTASALAILTITLLFRPTLPVAVLQTGMVLYTGIVYREVLAIEAVMLSAYYVWFAISEWSPRPLLFGGGVFLVTILSFQLRDMELLFSFVSGLATGANSGGFSMLGSPKDSITSYLAALLSLRSVIIGAVFTNNHWLELIVVLTGAAYLGLGLFLAVARRHLIWILPVLAIVFTSHIDRGALLSGRLELLPAVYQGPKAFLYFHFLWIALIVLGATSTTIRSLPPIYAAALFSIWLIPVTITGIHQIFLFQSWSAVWTVNDDLALISRIPPQKRLLVDTQRYRTIDDITRPADLMLWQQLAAYNGTMLDVGEAASDKGGPQAVYVTPNHWYWSRLGVFKATPLVTLPCPNPLGRSPGFTLCATVPSTLATSVKLNGVLTDWEGGAQPLISCGMAGMAVALGVKKVDDATAVLTIDEWGFPGVVSPPFAFVLNAPFEFLVKVDRVQQGIAISDGSGSKLIHRLVSPNSMRGCAVVTGRNAPGFPLISKRFNGTLESEMGR